MAGYEDWLKGMGIDSTTYGSYTPDEQIGIGQSYANLQTPDTGGGLMDWMGTDSAKNSIGLGGLAMTGLGAINSYRTGQQAKKQWEAENARANEIMAMNREKYNTYKADKERLNTGYSGSGLTSSVGVK